MKDFNSSQLVLWFYNGSFIRLNLPDNRIRHIPVIVEKGMVGMGRLLEDDEILCVSPVMPHTCRT
ncbi:hypothetical protein SCA6_009813 [Theobroma cacao]